MNLVVHTAFGAFKVGQEITDQSAIADILASPNQRNVNKVIPRPSVKPDSTPLSEFLLNVAPSISGVSIISTGLSSVSTGLSNTNSSVSTVSSGLSTTASSVSSVSSGISNTSSSVSSISSGLSGTSGTK